MASTSTSNNVTTTTTTTSAEPHLDDVLPPTSDMIIDSNNTASSSIINKEEEQSNRTVTTVKPTTLSAGAAAAAVSAGLQQLPTTTTSTIHLPTSNVGVVGIANGGKEQQEKTGNKLATTTNTKEQTATVGDPGYANALLSLGQDLTKSQSLELSEAAAAATSQLQALPLAPSGLGDTPFVLGTTETNDAGVTAVENDVTGTIAAARTTTMVVEGTKTSIESSNNNGDTGGGNSGKQQKRKHAETLTTTTTTTSSSNATNDDSPLDFWYWLPMGQDIGDWDVLCGRGGESNNYAGNKRYRKVINDRKRDYRKIDLKHRKMKTAFVRDIVHHINSCGGRFVDIDDKSGRFYVVTMEKARKKTSQALRETKELKWLEIDETKGGLNGTKKKNLNKKDVVCPFCKLPGHKTRIASSCLKHHEWLDASKAENLMNNNSTTGQDVGVTASQHVSVSAGVEGSVGVPPNQVQQHQETFLLPKDPLALQGHDPSSADPTASITGVATAVDVNAIVVVPESSPGAIPPLNVPYNENQIPMTTMPQPEEGQVGGSGDGAIPPATNDAVGV